VAKRARDLALIYAERRLAVWASWSRNNRESLGFPAVSMVYKAMRRRAERVRREQIIGGAQIEPALTAFGIETKSRIPAVIGEPPEAVAEVERVVIAMRPDLYEVIMADYFTYGPIEVRCKQTQWCRARYLQLLEAAKYWTYAALSAAGHAGDADLARQA